MKLERAFPGTARVRNYLNITIFAITLAIIAFGLRFQPSLSFIGLVVQLAVFPAVVARFRILLLWASSERNPAPFYLERERP
ncbi:hypothetical protein [Archaeoglobus neptunius]|uniref:hypothetical protein n=1 Tax=Archaeoglobus neptunius TaxID=2798580 RepID=UPI00192582FD|nr:hypothetical protein [Archaeoglobus neptunius]